MRIRLMPLLAALSLCFVTAARADDLTDPIPFKPHPQAGKFRASHDPDKPVLAFYGGIGLRKMPDGRWNGYGQTSEEDVKYLINRMRENGMGRVYASFQEEEYPSTVASSSPPGAPDYIKLFCELAHQNNIEVYGDTACFANVQSKCREFTAAHPDLFTRDAAGKLDEHMLSPAYPEVRRFKRAMLMEYVQNYPVDGLALDFIRYPYYGRDIRIGFGKHGYDAPALQIFRQRFGYPESYLPAIDDPRWLAVKAEQVNQFIREVRADLAAAGVQLPISAFNSGIYGARDSYNTVSQDWLAWETQKLIDEHCPMILLTHGMTNLIGATRDLVKIKRPGSIVMGPIFLDVGTDAYGNPPNPQRVRDAARRLIKLGCDGLWFCRASEIEQFDLWPTVKEISQWSISRIRAEQFDPAYENLLANPTFEKGLEGWNVQAAESAPPASNSASGAGGVRVSLSDKGPAVLSQKLKFVTLPYLSVDSLELSATVDASAAKADRPVLLEALLHYSDGQEEVISRSAGPAAGRGGLAHTFKVASDFDRHVLEWAEVRIVLPPGTGSIAIEKAEVLRDPLMNQPGYR